MKISPENFTDWFNRRIAEVGTVDEMATLTGIHRQTLYRLKNGSFPSAETMAKLNIALEVPKA